MGGVCSGGGGGRGDAGGHGGSGGAGREGGTTGTTLSNKIVPSDVDQDLPPQPQRPPPRPRPLPPLEVGLDRDESTSDRLLSSLTPSGMAKDSTPVIGKRLVVNELQGLRRRSIAAASTPVSVPGPGGLSHNDSLSEPPPSQDDVEDVTDQNFARLALDFLKSTLSDGMSGEGARRDAALSKINALLQEAQNDPRHLSDEARRLERIVAQAEAKINKHAELSRMRHSPRLGQSHSFGSGSKGLQSLAPFELSRVESEGGRRRSASSTPTGHLSSLHVLSNRGSDGGGGGSPRADEGGDKGQREGGGGGGGGERGQRKRKRMSHHHSFHNSGRSLSLTGLPTEECDQGKGRRLSVLAVVPSSPSELPREHDGHKDQLEGVTAQNPSSSPPPFSLQPPGLLWSRTVNESTSHPSGEPTSLSTSPVPLPSPLSPSSLPPTLSSPSSSSSSPTPSSPSSYSPDNRQPREEAHHTAEARELVETLALLQENRRDPGGGGGGGGGGGKGGRGGADDSSDGRDLAPSPRTPTSPLGGEGRTLAHFHSAHSLIQLLMDAMKIDEEEDSAFLAALGNHHGDSEDIKGDEFVHDDDGDAATEHILRHAESIVPLSGFQGEVD